MTVATKTQKRIQEAYAACYRLCESDRWAEQWLTRALDAARRGEKHHRRSLGRYKLPIADAARFFAVKWFFDPQVATNSYADACGLREDCLYALGARDRVILSEPKASQYALLLHEYADVLALDYVKEFTQ